MTAKPPVTVSCDDPRRPPGLELIAELDQHLAKLYPPESCQLLDAHALAAGDARFLVASAGTEPQGCGAFKLLEPGVAELKRMYVRPASRGRGVGATVLAALEREARALGIRLLRLETGVRQPEALRLYESHGYRRRGPFGAYRDDPLCVFFEKRLP